MTSASTQPPPTEPISRPSAPTSIFVPAGTGVEPRTRATVASAPACPARISSAAVFQTFIPKKIAPEARIASGARTEVRISVYDDGAVHPWVDCAVVAVSARDQRCLVCAARHGG